MTWDRPLRPVPVPAAAPLRCSDHQRSTDTSQPGTSALRYSTAAATAAPDRSLPNRECRHAEARRSSREDQKQIKNAAEARTSRSRSRTPRRPKKNLEDQQKKHAEACRRYAASSRRRLHLCRPSPRLPPPNLEQVNASTPSPTPSRSAMRTSVNLVDVCVHQLTRVSDPANFAAHAQDNLMRRARCCLLNAAWPPRRYYVVNKSSTNSTAAHAL